MRKALLTVLAMIVASATVVSASTVTPTATQTFKGKGSGYNDSASNTFLLSFVDSLGSHNSATLSMLDRVNAPRTREGGFLSVAYRGGAPSTSGKWSTTAPVEFVVYKAGSGFAVAYFAGGITGNVWNTGDFGLVNKKGTAQEISHISIYTAQPSPGGSNPPTSAVPLPAAGLLLAGGLVGMLGVGRMTRRRK